MKKTKKAVALLLAIFMLSSMFVITTASSATARLIGNGSNAKLEITVDGVTETGFPWDNNRSATYEVNGYAVTVFVQSNIATVQTVVPLNNEEIGNPGDEDGEESGVERQTVDVVLNNAGFHCNTYNGNGRVWVSNYEDNQTVTLGKNEDFNAAWEIFSDIYVCPNCWRTDWIIYNNKDDEVNFKNIQLQHSNEPRYLKATLTIYLAFGEMEAIAMESEIIDIIPGNNGFTLDLADDKFEPQTGYALSEIIGKDNVPDSSLIPEAAGIYNVIYKYEPIPPEFFVEPAWYDWYGNAIVDETPEANCMVDFNMQEGVNAVFRAGEVEGYTLESVTINGAYIKGENDGAGYYNFDFVTEYGEEYNIVPNYAKVFGQDDEIPGLKDVFAEWFSLGNVTPINGPSAILLKHFNVFTVGNEMKPSNHFSTTGTGATARLTGTSDENPNAMPTLNLSRTETALTSMKNAELSLRGHTLLWHTGQGVPGAFFREGFRTQGRVLTRQSSGGTEANAGALLADPIQREAERQEMIERLQWYITSIVQHAEWYAPGVIYAWDVINEAVDNNDETRLRPARTTNFNNESDNSPWMTTIGEDYIYLTFKFAREALEDLKADPDFRQHLIANNINPEEYTGPQLHYNDFGTNGSRKRQTMMRYLLPIIEDGYLDGIGEQGHHHIANSVPGCEESYRIYASTNGTLSFDVTEIDCEVTGDVPSPANTGDPVYRQGEGLVRQATWFYDFFEMLKSLSEDYGTLKHVIFWGMADNASWKRYTQNRTQVAANLAYPLLFESGEIPKAAYWAVTGIEGPNALVQEREVKIYEGGLLTNWDDQMAYPIGRIGTYKAVYDDDAVYFLITAEPGSKLEIAVGDEIYVNTMDENGSMIVTIPKPEIGDVYRVANVGSSTSVRAMIPNAVKFDIGIVTPAGKTNAWNSYFYKGYNLGRTAYQGILEFDEDPRGTWGIDSTSVINAGDQNPAIVINRKDSRYSFNNQRLGEGQLYYPTFHELYGIGDMVDSNMLLADEHQAWQVDTGTTGLTLRTVTNIGNNAGDTTTLYFDGTASAGVIKITGMAAVIGGLQVYAHTNTITITIG